LPWAQLPSMRWNRTTSASAGIANPLVFIQVQTRAGSV
jgi:hypothetical protein